MSSSSSSSSDSDSDSSTSQEEDEAGKDGKQSNLSKPSLPKTNPKVSKQSKKQIESNLPLVLPNDDSGGDDNYDPENCFHTGIYSTGGVYKPEIPINLKPSINLKIM